ncbi:MAG: hypothetical protein IT323_20585 [Anaerolineae bacterium]|nr:hypothetical protein [Anaerolineae bacterium]
MPKFTVLGGSAVAVPELIGSLAPYLHGGRALHVVLHGRDAEKLERVGRVCQRMAAVVPGLTVEYTTHLNDALRSADFVLNQVRVGGLDARAYDETFPHRWNLPGEETIGPGGAANALRTVPVVLDLCRIIENLAPECTLITFSNPSSVVQRAIAQSTSLRTVGLCDAPDTMRKVLARALGVDVRTLDTQYVGMHHFGFITSARVDGHERLPQALEDGSACTALGLEPEIGRLMGILPHPYFRYFFHPDRMLDKQRKLSQPRARELQHIEQDLLAAYEAHQGSGKPEAVARRSAIWYEVVVAPTLAGLAFGDAATLAVNVTNDGLIADLPADTIIEVTADVGGGEITPRPVRAWPPPALMGMLQANAAYERTLVDAILHDSQDVLLQALITHPLTPSYDVARDVVAEIWPRRGWPEGMRG